MWAIFFPSFLQVGKWKDFLTSVVKPTKRLTKIGISLILRGKNKKVRHCKLYEIYIREVIGVSQLSLSSLSSGYCTLLWSKASRGNYYRKYGTINDIVAIWRKLIGHLLFKNEYLNWTKCKIMPFKLKSCDISLSKSTMKLQIVLPKTCYRPCVSAWSL